MVRRGCAIAAETNARANLAAGDGVGIHRPTGPTYFPQTKRDEDRGGEIRIRFRISIETKLGDVRESARVRDDGAARSARSAPARHDRHPVVYLGAGLGRISTLAKKRADWSIVDLTRRLQLSRGPWRPIACAKFSSRL